MLVLALVSLVLHNSMHLHHSQCFHCDKTASVQKTRFYCVKTDSVHETRF